MTRADSKFLIVNENCMAAIVCKSFDACNVTSHKWTIGRDFIHKDQVKKRYYSSCRCQEGNVFVTVYLSICPSTALCKKFLRDFYEILCYTD